ncbi:MAG: NADH-quinone oxidoreductase subunit C [Actinomycetota bacterium]|nr:NADH-quinone oxidoreductase subunit C [Actinomycetota bacterium]
MTGGSNRRSVNVAAADVVDVFEGLLAEGFRLCMVACHQDEAQFRIVYVLLRPVDDRRVELVLTVSQQEREIPTLARLNYSAGRFEREMRDLYGIRPIGHPLRRRLVRHGHWPVGWYPMLREADPDPDFLEDIGSFPFLEVEGEGVYEIPVGPVHAGLIEPGHFRFSVVGETILRLKTRLWFVHRGIEKMLEGADATAGIEIAERISGDTAVGHSLAFAMALEEAAGIHVSENDRLIRALLLELERLHNHIADIGALANDVGYGLMNAHALRLRESLLRMNKDTTGHRLLRGAISIGGSHLIQLPDTTAIRSIADEAAELATITTDNATVRDRFVGTSVLSSEAARLLGALGYVARASGIDIDARRDHPFVDLGAALKVVVETGGDVMSRYMMRVREIQVSATLVTDLVRRLDTNTGSGHQALPNGPGAGLGLVEGWRGLIAHRVELDASGRITRAKIVDPSFFNWPALPVALVDTIVPDFPLTNKSFNQSYAGNDL